MSTTAGNFNVYFGTSKARAGLGMVIKSHTCDQEADEALVQDEDGNDAVILKYNKRKRETITGTLLRDTTSETARAALAVGATFATPGNTALASSAADGIPIIDSISTSTDATTTAEMTITCTKRPLITAMGDSDNSPATE